jgi:hypothetical protein
MHRPACQRTLALSGVLLLSASTLCAAAQPKPSSSYSVRVFAVGNDQYSQPDSIALANGHIFVGYGGNGLPDGSDGKTRSPNSRVAPTNLQPHPRMAVGMTTWSS